MATLLHGDAATQSAEPRTGRYDPRPTMKIATWNVNSIKARKDRLLAWLAAHSPDVLCLQELKLEASAFPLEDVRALGYHAVLHAQKTYNGVAILSRSEPQAVAVGFEDGVDDEQARAIAATIDGTRVLCVYVPNGGEPTSDKFAYKLKWLERLRTHLHGRHQASDALIVCGDLNIAPDDSDVARPDEWRGTVLCHDEVREAFRGLIGWGLVDCFRKHHPNGGAYSWWDYRMLGFPKGNGLRIDHVLGTAQLAERCQAASIDREQRKGKLPSDHAPVIIELGN
jgi:exodeoxyribonuclease III